MASIREGNQGVLMIVDVQVGVVQAAWDAERIVVPLIWVQHSSDELVPGSAPWQWAPELVPAPGETLIHKHFNSSFEETVLDDELARLGATHITLAGAATNWCIRATAYAALERGYDLTLVSDGHTTTTMLPDDGPPVEATSLIADLNLAITWLRYPGRRNGTAPAEQLSFAAPAGVR